MIGKGLGIEEVKQLESEAPSMINDMSKIFDEDLINTCEIYKDIKAQTLNDSESKQIELREKLTRTYKKLSSYHKRLVVMKDSYVQTQRFNPFSG